MKFSGRRVVSGFGVMLVSVMMMGCIARPKNIPNSDLVSLFKEFLLVGAYATDVLNLNANDSVDIYTPVLNKYGYTIEDFEYSIDNLSKRKSAQLSDIMEVAIVELKEEAEDKRILWSYWSAMVSRGKQLAVDTTFVDSLLNSRVIGEDGMRWEFEELEPGSYRVEYDYYVESRTGGERVYAELRDAADPTHIVNQWSLRTGDTVKGNHLFTIDESTEKVFISWRNRGNDTRALRMFVDSLQLSYEPADTIAIRLMEEQLRYNTDYSSPEEVVGRYLLTVEEFEKMMEEQEAAEESAKNEESTESEEATDSTN